MQFLKKIYYSCKKHINNFAKGIKHAFLWKKTEDTIHRSLKIRKTIKDLLLLNGFLLVFTVAGTVLLFPTINSLVGQGVEYSIFEWIYWMTCSMPINLIAGAVNIYHWADIAATLPVKSKPLEASGFVEKLNMASSRFYRFLLIPPGLFLQGYLLQRIPIVGPVLHFLSTSLLFSFYQFEYHWDASNWPIDRQISLFERNWAYFLGFGFPLTATIYCLPSLYATVASATLMPLYIIMAKHAFVQNDFVVSNSNDKELILKRIIIFTPISKIGIYALHLAQRMHKNEYLRVFSTKNQGSEEIETPAFFEEIGNELHHLNREYLNENVETFPEQVNRRNVLRQYEQRIKQKQESFNAENAENAEKEFSKTEYSGTEPYRL